MHAHNVTRDLFLPELKLIKQIYTSSKGLRIYLFEKVSEFEVCPSCATKAFSVYDHVTVNIKDAPIRNKRVILKIRKRRFKCPKCFSIFREPIAGIRKGYRTSQRFRLHLMWCCSHFSSLKRVAGMNRCSDWLVYKAYYEQLDLEMRKYQYPWPKTLGIDEHSFIRNQYGRKEFTTVFVDYNQKRIREAVFGRSPGELKACDRMMSIDGRENVKNVILDLSPGFRSFAKEIFPNAMLTADKFHVIKLLTPALQRYKREVIGSVRRNPFKTMLLKNGSKLKLHEKTVLRAILEHYPELRDIYTTKEAIHTLYRTKGYKQARIAFIKLTDWLAYSQIPELQTFRKTLMSWRTEILNYFKTGLTNARTEGYNRKAKLIQRAAYGFKNFDNYRLKLLYACR